jgi:ketosteroid isomerase-like protein
MGASNREIVQMAFESFGRGDIDAALALCDPDIVIRDPERTGTTFRGPEGLLRFFEEWLESWEEYRSEPVEFIESDDEILVHAIQTGKGKLSGIEINDDLFLVFRLRDGKFIEYRLYTEREAALASMDTAD